MLTAVSVVILLSDRIHFKTKTVARDRRALHDYKRIRPSGYSNIFFI